jgi:hypothetical protein
MEPGYRKLSDKAKKNRFWRFIVRLLTKWGVLIDDGPMREKVEFKAVTIDTNKLLDTIWEHVSNVSKFLDGRHPRIIVMGRDFMDNIMTNRDEYLAFNMSSIPGTPPTLLGMEVVCMPWLDGFFVIP